MDIRRGSAPSGYRGPTIDARATVDTAVAAASTNKETKQRYTAQMQRPVVGTATSSPPRPNNTTTGSNNSRISTGGGHSHRLYKAPQASSFRNNGAGDGVSKKYDDVTLLLTGGGSNTRRRRMPDNLPSHYSKQLSNSSLNNNNDLSERGCLPEAPSLWQEDADLSQNNSHINNKIPHPLHCLLASQTNTGSVPEMTHQRSPLRPRRPISNRNLHVNSGYEDYSERGGSQQLLDEDSHTGTPLSGPRSTYSNNTMPSSQHHHHHNNSRSNMDYYYEDKPATPSSSSTSSRSLFRNLMAPAHLVQICVLLLLAGIVYDSHHRVKAHKVKLKEYDEERAHILEQMMWIDKAAKKLHTKYSPTTSGTADVAKLLDNKNNMGDATTTKGEETSTREELVEETRQLRDELEQLQVRIQLNARDRIRDSFGDKPLQISLKLPPTDDADSDNDMRELLLALSEDTPHAAATLVQQIEHQKWKEMIFEPVEHGSVVQVTSTLPTSTPMLEFAEASRGCHRIGSVALRSTSQHELNILQLRIHMVEHAPFNAETDVCIGKITDGLDNLANLPERVY